MNDMFLKMGHRGAMGYVAENTMEAVQLALELGVDGVEVDVHVCGSGELVVFHDFTLDRMTNGSGEISKWTLSDLKQLKVDSAFYIPTLEEILNLVGDKYLVNIELKGNSTALKTCEIIQDFIKTKYWNYSNFLVSSFQHGELEQVFRIDKAIPMGVLTETNLIEAIAFAETINAWSIHPNYTLLTSENVKYAQAKGYKVITWTVNEMATIKRMKQYGVDGIISDKPDIL